MTSMPAPQLQPGAGSIPGDAAGGARHDRPELVAFISDGETEAALREGLIERSAASLHLHRGGIKAAIVQMRKSPTPRLLIVDVSGEAHPLSALGDLADVVEPDVQVLVIGEIRDVDFYRQVTRGLGIAEYLSKPVTRDMVSRHFAPFLMGQGTARETMQGGRIVAVTGARGGVGATTIAAHLSWHFAVDMRRHTVLLDPDLYLGDAAMLLNATATSGLRTALETPDRLDGLFVERATRPIENNDAADRLHILAGEEPLGQDVVYAPDAASRLLQVLQRRYGFIVIDVPFRPMPLFRELIGLAHQRILIMDPSLASVRDTLRLLAMLDGAGRTQRPLIAVNRAGRPGGLTRRQIEEGLGRMPDVSIADLPRKINLAATLGDPQSAMRGAFRSNIVELARLSAFERLLDSTAAGAEATRPGGRPKFRLFGRRT